jgi:NAD(P)-dependent dehydrogenase (short-subunit alcohol dehydrogenase family)
LSVKSKPLTGRDHVTTGATRGIGRGIGAGRGRRGADVALNYQRSAEAAESVTGGLMTRLNYYLSVLEGVEALVLRSAILLLLIIAVIKLIFNEIG